MMRKLLILFNSIILFLAACAAPAGDTATPQAPASEASATTAFATPDQSLAIPTIGAVTILATQGDKTVFLYSLPTIRSIAAAQVEPGDSGQILGVDSSGTWLLVKIKGQTGWAPIQLLDYTIAQ
jgi:hypothetical protein